jgi:uncharacterized protein (DUF1684 family)
VTTIETEVLAGWERWHAEREHELRAPHGWLSLTALEWLDTTARTVAGLPGSWRVTADGDAVELSAVAADGLTVDGRPVDGTQRLEPVDGKPGTIVVAGDRRIEVVRRTAAYALRVRDPQAPTRTGFAGVPVFPVDERWVVAARYLPFDRPRRIVVDAVVEGLQHFPTAVGEVEFALDGGTHRLLALGGQDTGLVLHFRDATSGVGTYGGGRVVRTADPGPDGRVDIDFNRTVNLPCAFTAYATCPLPPAENRLPVAVAAGERSPA